jgi:hypothetical protein
LRVPDYMALLTSWHRSKPIAGTSPHRAGRES